MSKHVIKNVRVSNLVLDRAPLSPRTMEIALHFKAGKFVPPIHVQIDSRGRMIVRDGRHRTVAARLAGKRFILAKLGDKPSLQTEVLAAKWPEII